MPSITVSHQRRLASSRLALATRAGDPRAILLARQTHAESLIRDAIATVDGYLRPDQRADLAALLMGERS